jgi:hypothetical protein
VPICTVLLRECTLLLCEASHSAVMWDRSRTCQDPDHVPNTKSIYCGVWCPHDPGRRSGENSWHIAEAQGVAVNIGMNVGIDVDMHFRK